jgi:hypothetical protein
LRVNGDITANTLTLTESSTNTINGVVSSNNEVVTAFNRAFNRNYILNSGNYTAKTNINDLNLDVTSTT